MFEGQPKGLYALALANTGERFGYYTMLAIFTLFIQAKFGYTAAEASSIYAGFLAFVYFTPLIGGILADHLGYGKMVTMGIIVMFFGYFLLAIPTDSVTGKWMMFGSLALIACGTGLFKGNLQVMVGNLYDAPQYRNKRDTAFSIFYMAINVGALFAPTAATKMTDYMLNKAGLFYDSKIPALAHQFLNHTITADNTTELSALQAAQHFAGDTATFCQTYIAELSKAYNYGFGIACLSLIVSILIYYGFRSTFKSADFNAKQAKAAHIVEEELSPKETRQRIVALLLVFAVVLFFWMAFHQNGLTLTFFARDYTQHSATGLNRIGFDVWNLVLIIIGIYSAFSIFQSKTRKAKIISGTILGAALVLLVVKYMPTGLMLPLYGNTTQNERFRQQLDASLPLKKQLWQQTTKYKIENQAAVLRKHTDAETKCMKKWAEDVKSGDPDNLEGRAAAYYWKNLFGVCIPNFTRGREGVPPNNLLNYGYAILRAIVARALVSSGLLPTLGIHHHNRYNAYCLADDIMPIWRLADKRHHIFCLLLYCHR